MLAPRAVKRKATGDAQPGGSSSGPAAGASTFSEARMIETQRDTGDQASGKESRMDIDDVKDSFPAKPTVAAPLDSGVDMSKDGEGSRVAVGAGQAHAEQADANEAAKELARLKVLKEVVEECFSDWALSTQHPELFRKIGLSLNGYVHISNLLSLPPVSMLTSNMADIKKALESSVSEILKLDETGFQIARLKPVDLDALDRMTAKDWSTRTFYLENIPYSASQDRTQSTSSLRKCLEELLGTGLVTLRLPQLYDPASNTPSATASTSKQTHGYGGRSDGRSRGPTRKGKERALVDNDEANETPAQKAKRERSYALPLHGGPFKGFAFVILEDQEKANEALERWHWDKRGSAFPSASGNVSEEEDAEAGDAEITDDLEVLEQLDAENEGGEAATQNMLKQTPELHRAAGPEVSITGLIVADAPVQHPQDTIQARADVGGFRVMPITTFNALKQEYLSYARDITLLREKHEQLNGSYKRHRGSASPPPQYGRHRRPNDSSKRKRSPSPARWETKPLLASPPLENGKWRQKPLSPSPERPNRKFDAKEQEHPRGCVVFFKRINPEVNLRTLRSLFEHILESEELDVGKLQYVDFVRNVNSCYIRFSDAATASFLASYFNSPTKKYLHIQPNSTDPSEAFSPASKDEQRPIEAEVLSGTPEAIYWSKVPLKARKGYAQGEEAEERVEEQSDSLPYEPGLESDAKKSGAADAEVIPVE